MPNDQAEEDKDKDKICIKDQMNDLITKIEAAKNIRKKIKKKDKEKKVKKDKKKDKTETFKKESTKSMLDIESRPTFYVDFKSDVRLA